MDASQEVLDNIVTGANAFIKTLIAARDGGADRSVLVNANEAAFKSFTDSVNSTYGGVYLFAGQNTEEQPMQDYFSSATTPSVQVANAFQDVFGFANDNGAVSQIGPSDMQSFIEGGFSNLFSESNWAANWTTATPSSTTNLISQSNTANTSVTAFDLAFRKIASAYALIADSGVKNLGAATFQVTVDAAVKALSEGTAMVTNRQADLGSTQQQIEDSTASMKRKIDIATEYIGRTEEVDLPSLSVRLNSILNQLDATYAITARMQRLSLLDAL